MLSAIVAPLGQGGKLSRCGASRRSGAGASRVLAAASPDSWRGRTGWRGGSRVPGHVPPVHLSVTPLSAGRHRPGADARRGTGLRSWVGAPSGSGLFLPGLAVGRSGPHGLLASRQSKNRWRHLGPKLGDGRPTEGPRLDEPTSRGRRVRRAVVGIYLVANKDRRYARSAVERSSLRCRPSAAVRGAGSARAPGQRLRCGWPRRACPGHGLRAS